MSDFKLLIDGKLVPGDQTMAVLAVPRERRDRREGPIPIPALAVLR